jgi:hypothetical protein
VSVFGEWSLPMKEAEKFLALLVIVVIGWVQM